MTFLINSNLYFPLFTFSLFSEKSRIVNISTKEKMGGGWRETFRNCKLSSPQNPAWLYVPFLFFFVSFITFL
jgi:hypothetical protein